MELSIIKFYCKLVSKGENYIEVKDNIYKTVMEVEEDDKLSVETPGNDFYRYLLTDEERERIIEADSPLYRIETYRGKIGNEVEMDGYEEIYSILVDDFKVATIFKKNGGN